MSTDKTTHYTKDLIDEAMTERKSFVDLVKQRPFLICRLCDLYQEIPETVDAVVLDLIGCSLSLGYCSLISGKLDLSCGHVNIVPDAAYRWSDDYACFLGIPQGIDGKRETTKE